MYELRQRREKICKNSMEMLFESDGIFTKMFLLTSKNEGNCKKKLSLKHSAFLQFNFVGLKMNFNFEKIFSSEKVINIM